jgi:cytochrome c5
MRIAFRQKGLALVLSGLPLVAAAQVPAEHAQLLETYCHTCHNAEDWSGSLDLESYDLSNAVADAEVWENVLRKFRGNMMPPQGNPRPSDAEFAALAQWLTHTIDTATLAENDPGKSSLHRLNRTEYGNAVRDLLALDVDVAEYLPADDEGYGFDNIADVLRTSPTLLEQYLGTSRKIAELALGDPRIAPISKVYKVAPDLPQAQHIPGLPLGTRGGIAVEHNFPLDAEYEFSNFLTRNIVGYMTGLEWPHEFEISIDGERVFHTIVGGEEDNLASDRNFSEAANMIDARLKTRLPVSAGKHKVVVTFIQKNAAETHEPLELFTRNLDLQDMVGVPTLDYIDIVGPFNATGSGSTASRDKVFTCYPASAADNERCARDILGTLGRRAFRRPLAEKDMNLLLSFYEEGSAQGNFEQGIQTALRFILTSPEFLFRSEPDPHDVKPGDIYALDDIALASRLSFFLWSSIPDDELLALAEQDKLSDEATLDAQIERMLRDPKATALVDNFVAQWLFLRNLRSINPDTRTFPNFDDKLRQAFRTETEMFAQSIIREDRSVVDFLDADYTYVNDRLAQHYGIANIYGSHFRRVTLDDENRRGLLGQGSVLTVTSYPNRTSPVLRGKWLLENIIGAPAPPPPPNVPDLPENEAGGVALSVRERLEQHREDPACRGCHAVMDPLGFSLESFDGIGRYRVRDAAGAIDSAGELADGTPVNGVNDLRRVLLGKPEVFVDTVSEKLLTYALGRGLTHKDMPVVRAITRNAADQDYRFSALVKGIVRSTPFRMKRAEGLDVSLAAE